MIDFEIAYDDENTTPQQTAEFSLEYDDNQPDFTKVKANEIFSTDGSNTNAPMKLQKVNKSWMQKFTESDFAKFGETQSKAVVRGLYQLGGGVGSMISWYGDNMILEKGALGLDDKTVDRINTFGRGWQKFGEIIKKGSDFVLNDEGLKLDEEIFAGDIIENPSLTRVTSAVMSAVPSLMSMVGIAKATGSTALSYFLMSGADSSEIYEKSKEKGDDLEKTNLLYTSSMAGTALIDKFFSPLEKIMGGSATTIWKKLTNRVVAGLSESGAEGGQSWLQNVVTKYGIDDTQDLFEGVFEAMIGGFGGGAVASGMFQKASDKLKSKGATQQEIDGIIEKGAEFIQNNANEVNDIVYQHMEKGMASLDKFIEENKDEALVKQALEKKQQLETIYNNTYNELKNIMPEQEAKSNAALIRNSAFFFAEEFGISPEEFVKRRGVKVRKSDYNQFSGKATTSTTEDMPIMQVTQRDINYARSHPEWKSNARIINMIGQAGADINDSLDNINKALKEYSIKEHQHAKEMETAEFDRKAKELSEDLQERYAMMVENGVSPQEAYDAITYTGDYIPFQTGVSEIDSSQLYQNLPQDLKNAVDFIYTSAPVYEVTGKEFPNDGTSLNKRVLQYFTDKFQNVIDVSDLGEVLLDARSIKDSTIHGLSSNKANAFAAVPYVLKNGKMFLSQEHYDGKNENRYVFVAPIKLKNEDYFCEVVVRQGIETQKGVEKLGKRRFYIHEVELIKKLSDDFTTFQQGSSSSSKSIISKQINDVKKNLQSQGGVRFQESLNIAVENAALDKVNPAYEGETININGVERTVYNSNGDRIAMSEPALRNFYNWFGDSKVIDEQGRPLVVYHGTSKGGFSSFSVDEIGSNTGNADNGFFFGDYELAKTYTARTDFITEEDIKFYEEAEEWERSDYEASGIYAVYLKASDVEIWDFQGASWDGVAYGKYALRNEEEYDWLRDENGNVVLFDSIDEVQEYVDEHPEVEDYTQWDDPQIYDSTRDLANLAKDNDADGLIVKNVADQGRYGYGGEEGNVYVVFNPNQIKSTSNRGTYSESDNIYFQSAFAGSRVDYDQPSLEAIGTGEGAQAHGWGLYYALSKDVAEGYRKAFYDVISHNVAEKVKELGKEEAIEYYKQEAQKAENRVKIFENEVPVLAQKAREDAKAYNQMAEMAKTEGKGQVHEVDIPENPYLLDEDLYFKHQSEFVKEKLARLANDYDALNGNTKFADALLQEGQTGRTIYNKLAQLLGNEEYQSDEYIVVSEESKKQASQLLESYGIKGITYMGRRDGRCFVIFNPDDVKVIQKFYQDGANDPKGAYVNRIIHLFQNADASTLPHELAHFWKDTLKDAAKMSKRAAKMLEDVEKWAEQEFNRKYSVQLKDSRYVVNNKQGLTVYDHNFRTEADAKEYAKEELFAQGNEAYLKEGIAPNNSLKQAFRNFLNWLKHIYNQARQLDIRLSPDIRQVYADILGGTEIDFFLNTDPDTFVENRIKLATETVNTLDEQIAEAQRMGVTVSEPDGRGLKHAWETAMIPLSTRLGRVSNKLKNRLRRYEFDIANSLNHYYDEARPFLQKWKTFSEMDTIAFDIALKNDYVKKQLEIVDKYGAREEWEKVRKLLLDIFDSAVKAGLDVNFRPDYFPRKVKDVQGFLSYLRGRPEWTKFEEALRDADPDHTFTAEEQADFINKYLRGFIKVDLMPYKYGSEKQRSIEIINNEMNKYYAPSMESLVSYIEGMNARIEASKFLGRDAEELEASIGGYLDYLINNKELDPNKVDEVKEILKARFNQKGVGNKWIAGARNIAYMYTMGGINSAITQIEDLSVSMYKAGIWNTLTTAFENKKIKRADLGLDKISAEFVENPSQTARGVEKLFKLTGLDKIDSFGKETLVNAMVKKFKQMSEASLRQYIEPIMEQETTQTIQDIKNGELSDNVLYLVFSELSDVQPISLSELPAFYNTSGNLRILYMLKSFMIKRIDIFRNECFDKLRSKDKEARIQGMQNLFRLAILMIFCGVSKDWLINMLYGRKMDVPETVVNNALGLVGFSKFHAYQLRDKGAGEVIKDFLMPPMFAPYDDLIGDVVRIGRGKRDLKDAETLKGIPLVGRFYYWHIGRGKEKQNKRSKLK